MGCNKSPPFIQEFETQRWHVLFLCHQHTPTANPVKQTFPYQTPPSHPNNHIIIIIIIEMCYIYRIASLCVLVDNPNWRIKSYECVCMCVCVFECALTLKGFNSTHAKHKNTQAFTVLAVNRIAKCILFLFTFFEYVVIAITPTTIAPQRCCNCSNFIWKHYRVPRKCIFKNKCCIPMKISVIPNFYVHGFTWI